MPDQGVNFAETRMVENNYAQTVEGSILVYANWSGIHDFEFRDEIFVASHSSQSDLELASIDGGFQVDFDVSQAGWAISIQTSIDTYTVGVDQASVAYVMSASNGTLDQIPINGKAYGKVKIGFREQNYSDRLSDVWATFAIWINGSQRYGYAQHAGTFSSTSATVTLKGGSLTYSNVRIPQLYDHSEWASIDPGENASGGLNRALEGRYITLRVRHDGSLYAKTSKPTPSVKDYTSNDLFSRSKTFDKRQLASHIRMMGAYEWAEYVDESRLSQHRHRFIEVNNPYLMTERECRKQAERQTYRLEEASETLMIEVVTDPALELEDHVTVDGEDWIVSERNIQFQGVEAISSISLSKYVGSYGS